MRYLTKIAFGFIVLIIPALAALAQTTTWPVSLNLLNVTNVNETVSCTYYDSDGNPSNAVDVEKDGTVSFTKSSNTGVQGAAGNYLTCSYAANDATQHINCSPVLPGQTVDLLACSKNQTLSPDLEKSNL